jgi:hypothetical protein
MRDPDGDVSRRRAESRDRDATRSTTRLKFDDRRRRRSCSERLTAPLRRPALGGR